MSMPDPRAYDEVFYEEHWDDVLLREYARTQVRPRRCVVCRADLSEGEETDGLGRCWVCVEEAAR